MSSPEREKAKGSSRLRNLVLALRAGAIGDRQLHPSLVATYRLRSVALGAVITAGCLAIIVVYVALAQHVSTEGFVPVIALNAVLLGAVVLIPWNRVLVSKWAMRALYAWSITQVLIVALAVREDGGASSSFYLMFFVLLAFFAIAYTKRIQMALFIVTVCAYLVALWAGHWHIAGNVLFLRLALLTLTAAVSSVLGGWLVAEMRDRAKSISAAEQRAGMLDTVARAARRVSSLDLASVMSGALSGAMELGCFEAELWMLDGDPKSLQLQRRLAMDSNSANERLAYEIFRNARATGVTQIIEIEGDCIVGCLLHSEGEPIGLLLTKIRSALAVDSLIVECIELLAAQVAAGIEVARNVAERRGLEERLAHWAFHDSLTDLPNRVLFADRLELALARTARDDTMVAVLFLDLDGFKGINDTLGHAAGDELLQNVSRRLLGCLRPNDTLARYGGDEFVVLVEQVETSEAAILVAQRILDALSHPVRVSDQHLYVKTSIGIALAGAHPNAHTDVLRRADMAMYEAKTSGGSRYVLSS